eukprot:Phypoly_transcript_20277.p1 GENE.Phypoly_transcript_20277~~Phypoly_transcript_20277.p1  ORF type:complete len:163 (+),score=9.56 Phypoly_transcript_20277:199-687(+)
MSCFAGTRFKKANPNSPAPSTSIRPAKSNTTVSDPPESDMDPGILTICFGLVGEAARVADSVAGGAGAGPNGVPANLTNSTLLRAHLTAFLVLHGLQYVNEGVFSCPYPICESSVRITQAVGQYAQQHAWARGHPAMGSWIVGVYITSTNATPYNGAPGWGF